MRSGGGVMIEIDPSTFYLCLGFLLIAGPIAVMGLMHVVFD